jgi:hypothetical protein
MGVAGWLLETGFRNDIARQETYGRSGHGWLCASCVHTNMYERFDGIWSDKSCELLRGKSVVMGRALSGWGILHSLHIASRRLAWRVSYLLLLGISRYIKGSCTRNLEEQDKSGEGSQARGKSYYRLVIGVGSTILACYVQQQSVYEPCS